MNITLYSISFSRILPSGCALTARRLVKSEQTMFVLCSSVSGVFDTLGLDHGKRDKQRTSEGGRGRSNARRVLVTVDESWSR